MPRSHKCLHQPRLRIATDHFPTSLTCPPGQPVSVSQGALEASYRQLEAATAGIGQHVPYRRVGFQDYIDQLDGQRNGEGAQLDTSTSTGKSQQERRSA
jgi:hypothetical protein